MPEVKTRTCALCHIEVTAHAFPTDVLDALSKEETQQARIYECGYECNICGEFICPICKKEHIGNHDLVGACPRCGNPWAPKRTFFRTYLERANCDLFRKLCKLEKSLVSGSLPRWPGVTQILLGIVLIVLGFDFVPMGASPDSGVKELDQIARMLAALLTMKNLLSVLLGASLMINGLCYFLSGSSFLRFISGMVLIGLGLAMFLLWIHVWVPAPKLPIAGVIVFAIQCAVCGTGAVAVGMRHVIVYRRHSADTLRTPV